MDLDYFRRLYSSGLLSRQGFLYIQGMFDMIPQLRRTSESMPDELPEDIDESTYIRAAGAVDAWLDMVKCDIAFSLSEYHELCFFIARMSNNLMTLAKQEYIRETCLHGLPTLVKEFENLSPGDKVFAKLHAERLYYVTRSDLRNDK